MLRWFTAPVALLQCAVTGRHWQQAHSTFVTAFSTSFARRQHIIHKKLCAVSVKFLSTVETIVQQIQKKSK